jgi:Bacterial dnaA protein helix-turn-helix
VHDYFYHTDLLSHCPCPTQPLPTAGDKLLDTLIGALRANRGHPELAVRALAAATLKQVQRMQEVLRRAALPAERLELIAWRVCLALQVDAEQLIRGKRKTQHLAFCRQLAMYLCRQLSGASFPQIGVVFDHHHSSVISACQAIERRLADSHHGLRFRRLVEQLAAHITQTIDGDFSAIRLTAGASKPRRATSRSPDGGDREKRAIH